MQPRIIRRWERVPGALTTLERLHEYADNLATNEQDKRGACRTQWIIVTEDDAVILMTPWEDEAEKMLHITWLRQSLQNQKVLRYAFICEAWLRRADLKRPGEFGERVDSLIINSVERGGRHFWKQYEVGKGRGKKRTRTVSDLSLVESVQGLMFDLFGNSPPETPEAPSP